MWNHQMLLICWINCSSSKNCFFFCCCCFYHTFTLKPWDNSSKVVCLCMHLPQTQKTQLQLLQLAFVLPTIYSQSSLGHAALRQLPPAPKCSVHCLLYLSCRCKPCFYVSRVCCVVDRPFLPLRQSLSRRKRDRCALPVSVETTDLVLTSVQEPTVRKVSLL